MERVLLARPFDRDWRVYIAGVVCLLGAMGLKVWAVSALVDPGFFARTTTFLIILLLAGVTLLCAAMSADFLIARVAIPSRDGLVEKTLSAQLKVDASIVQKLIAQTDRLPSHAPTKQS